MPRVLVTLTNRYAYIEAPNKLVHEQLSGYWSFSAPGAIYTPAHKLWIRERKRAIEDGEPDRKVVGWDGKIRVFQRGKVPAGVFRATWRDAQEALSLKFRIVRDRPKPKPFLKGFDSGAAKYHYQNQCVEAMKANVRRGGGIILAATACLAGDTYIDVPRNLVKHPHGRKIKDLVGKRPWVYCFDTQKNTIDLVRASSVHKSGVAVPVYKVTFKPLGYKNRFGGRKYAPLDYLVGTADHLVLLREQSVGKSKRRQASGEYRSIKDLQPGDRVMPFFRNMGLDSKYAYINLNNGDMAREHRFILTKTKGARSNVYDGHHKNTQKFDNRVCNLQWKKKSKHHSDHAKERRARGEFTGWSASGIHPRGMAGKTQTAHQRRIASITGKKNATPELIALRGAILTASRKARWKKIGLTPLKLRQWYQLEGRSSRWIATKVGVSQPTVLTALKQFGLFPYNNHIVKKVEFLGYRDVYDISVPKHHNFVANGVVVHNSGKTKIFAQFASKVVYSCLFVVDQTDLLYQSQKEIAMWLKEKVGIVGDSEYVIQRVTVATIQTLQYHLADPVFLAWFKKVKIIVVDELHKAMAKRTFALFDVVKPIARFGLTATLQLKKKPVRFKAWAFAGPVIFEFPLLQGQKLGVLAKGHAVQLLFPEVAHHLPSSRRSDEPLEVEVLTNEEKMRTCARLARYLIGRGRYVIVLVDRIAHIKAVHKAHSHITHRIAYGATKRKRRVVARKKFEQGDIRLIIASRIFTQAINIKRVDAIFDLAEKRDLNDPIQKFGRGIRLHKDKKFLLYVDFGTQTGKFNKYAKGRAREMKAAGIEVKKFKVNDGDDAIAVIKKTMTRLEKLYEKRT